MNRLLSQSLIVAALAIVASGCSESGNPGKIPETKDPKAAREFIENPAGITGKPKMNVSRAPLSKDSQYPK